MIFLQTFDELRNFLFQFPKLGLSWPNEPWFIFLFSVKEIKKKKVDNIFVQISLTGFQQPKILWFEFKKSLEDVFGRSKQKAFCIQHLVLTFLSRTRFSQIIWHFIDANYTWRAIEKYWKNVLFIQVILTIFCSYTNSITGNFEIPNWI